MFNFIKKNIFEPIEKLQPSEKMILGFGVIILIGTVLLSLPISSQSGTSTSFINALFTATSAVCVTGLITVDTATHWNQFGQAIILILIQIGGLGFMTIATSFALIAKKKIQLKDMLVIQESLNQLNLSGLIKLTKKLLLLTFIIEGLGALILATEFIPQLGLPKGLWYSIFHSVSAFCNAGFDLMGDVSGAYTSLTFYVNNFTVSITISLLILLGGLGFPVLIEIFKFKGFNKLSIHSKIVLITTGIITAISVLLIFINEFNNPNTMSGLSIGEKLLASFFQSITARTAGFNTIDISLMSQASIFTIIILMFIGASPASTGGGVKTTTMATVALHVKSSIMRKEDVEIYGRRLSMSIVKKSMGVFFIVITMVSIGTLTISMLEPSLSLTGCWFEVMSALTTAGLSIVGTTNLSIISKLMLIIYMFVGRVGSLTIFIALTSHSLKTQKAHIRYPEEKILVG